MSIGGDARLSSLCNMATSCCVCDGPGGDVNGTYSGRYFGRMNFSDTHVNLVQVRLMTCASLRGVMVRCVPRSHQIFSDRCLDDAVTTHCTGRVVQCSPTRKVSSGRL